MKDQVSAQDRFLAKLSSQAQIKLFSLGVAVRYLAGETIYRKGEASLHLYLVQKGQVAIEIPLPSNRRETLMTIGGGGVFGWAALLESGTAPATARAVEEVKALRIEGRALRDLCAKDPEFGVEFYRALAGSLSARLNVASGS